MKALIKRHLIIVFLLGALGLLVTATPARQDPGKTENPSHELQEDLSKMDSLLQTRNLDSLAGVADKTSNKWQMRDPQSLVTYLLRVCSLLSSYDWNNETRQSLLLSRYAFLALASGKPSLQEHVQLVEFLTLDPLTLDEAAWESLRLRKARLFLETRKRLADSIIPNFNFDDRPMLNVKTPANSGVPSGISPEYIKDPKLRSDYERAIAQNLARARLYNDQYWLKRNAPRFYEETESYLVNAYSRRPTDLAQLKELLREYIESEAARNRIIAEVQEHQMR